MYKLQPAPERRYVFSASTRIAAGARDLSRRNVSTAQTRPQNSKASFAHQHPCGLKSALRRSRGDHAKHIPRPTGEGTARPVSRSFQSGWIRRPTEDDSPSPIRWERAGVRVECAPKSEAVFARVLNPRA